MQSRAPYTLIILTGLLGIATPSPAQQRCEVRNRCAIPDWVWPRSRSNLTAEYFDRRYPRDPAAAPPRQHLGIDLTGRAGVSVQSPASGTIVEVHASRDPSQAYMVIYEPTTGFEHVLGHVTTTFRVGRRVARGEDVARIMAWPRNSHVHWGTNLRGIRQATGTSSRRGWGAGNWGWGRAPLAATPREAAERGWIDPEVFARRSSRR